MTTMETLKNLPSKFSISVPGKVILLGEHSVVYGHLAIAASLNLRSKLEYTCFDELNENDFVHIKLPNIKLDISLSSSDLNHLLTSLSSKNGWDFNNPFNVDFDNLVLGVETFIKSQTKFHGLETQQLLGLKCCLFLMVAILNCPNQPKLAGLKPFLLSLTSDLPVGAGAGSSASFCVSLAAFFVCLASLREEPRVFCLDEKTKDLISNWAFLGERITHGNPSGLDNNVCAFGSLIAFRRPNTITKIPLCSGVRVLLVDTKVSRNTRTLVERVATLKSHHEAIVQTIMKAMESICVEAEKLFKLLDEAKKCHSTEESLSLFSRMEELWSMNHSLLQALGVSHPSLDQIVQMSKKHNLVGKLTGAGGGGFAIVLVPTGKEKALTLLKDELLGCGFGVSDVELGGPGVQLHLN
ncbi:mevalonate kinase [Thrips palmi]|uniref:Mevalonate kinase n=1 Tax=Thrips palmi TaxID=161013 RepID=A0A6P8YC22_THRPL|nr:mevalonate kinase [Thrips palmi]